MLKAPFTYNPASTPDKAYQRARVVLSLMVDQGKISAGRSKLALRSGTRRRGQEEPIWVETLNFTDWVMADINRRSPEFCPDTGTQIPLTLQIMLQFRAEMMIRKDLDRAGLENVEAAYMAMGFDGSVKVMVGQREFQRHNVNFAAQTVRQPASTFKPIVFAAALSVSKLNVDESLKHLLAISNNDFARRVFVAIGAKAVVSMAKKLGIKSELNPVSSLVLGAPEVRLIEMVRACAPFANKGRRPNPFG